MKTTTFAALTTATLLLTGCLGSQNWYDYGNGKINLNQVSKIVPRFSGEVYFPGSSSELFSIAMSEFEIDTIVRGINYRRLDAMPFYKFSIVGIVSFDLFSVEFMDTVKFVKLPMYGVNPYFMTILGRQTSDPVFLPLFSKLEGRLFITSAEFSDSLASITHLDTSNYWVKSNLIPAGLGEEGEKFWRANNNETVRLMKASDSVYLKKSLDACLKKYEEVPAK